MFHVNEVPTEAVEFSALIVKSAAMTKEAVADLRNFKKSRMLGKKLAAVSAMGLEGDMLHTKCVRKLFRNASDPVKKLVWTTIYEDMNDCIGDCANAAKTIEYIVMKNL